MPNKNLITGTILNWTLSASVNRVIIPVGVAYGSDSEAARQILFDVAADNLQVIDDPPPRTTFEAFADSSLTLTLRAYLPNVDDRLKAIAELHTEIDKRFAEAGIEIAFPQRDLNLRSGWTTADKLAGPGEQFGSTRAEALTPPEQAEPVRK
ncbi:mechanosensitive ion channel family protein [Novipirellula artificiosorum]|uniref:Putative MscS family protein.1 n=1 Tax=Novipirellula artificiosorum TaxID=2528016 RepID=A0A5C6DTB4_9BACT|nr:mechanosensitive ion channel domain-containing protein [Novipirellula artificiosorum]TWU39545.1 putative MscS family protein.1 precursor [Novipirellula artificiosorum]